MRDIICVGASAGGVGVLQEMAAGFPADLPASVFVVLHIPPFQESRLAEILGRAGPLPAQMACHGERIARRRIYVAPPDHHLLLERRTISVIKGPKENRCRPAIDPLFRSAAQYFPQRAIGVLLSGMLDDGTAGLWALKRSGGLAVTQDLADAAFADMPRNASAHVKIDHAVTAAGLGALLTRLATTPAPKRRRSPIVTKITCLENQYARLEDVPRETLEKIGTPSSLICPGCNGPLWQLDEGPRRFRCHTGHTYTPATLLEDHRELTERTLAVLMTLFEDEITLTKHVIETSSSSERVAEMKQNLQESEARATELRKLLPGGFEQRFNAKRKH